MVVSHLILMGLVILVNLAAHASDPPNTPSFTYEGRIMPRAPLPKLTLIVYGNDLFRQTILPIRPILEISIGEDYRFFLPLTLDNVTFEGEPSKVTEIAPSSASLPLSRSPVSINSRLIIPNQIFQQTTGYPIGTLIYTDLLKGGRTPTEINFCINFTDNSKTGTRVLYT